MHRLPFSQQNFLNVFFHWKNHLWASFWCTLTAKLFPWLSTPLGSLTVIFNESNIIKGTHTHRVFSVFHIQTFSLPWYKSCKICTWDRWSREAQALSFLSIWPVSVHIIPSQLQPCGSKCETFTSAQRTKLASVASFIIIWWPFGP